MKSSQLSKLSSEAYGDPGRVKERVLSEDKRSLHSSAHFSRKGNKVNRKQLFSASHLDPVKPMEVMSKASKEQMGSQDRFEVYSTKTYNSKTTSMNSRPQGRSQVASLRYQNNLVEQKLEQNRLKNKLKNLFRDIDEGKLGVMPAYAFFQILKLHKVEISPEARVYLLKYFSENLNPNWSTGNLEGTKMAYREALRVIGIDSSQISRDDPDSQTGKQVWKVIKNQPDAAKIYECSDLDLYSFETMSRKSRKESQVGVAQSLPFTDLKVADFKSIDRQSTRDDHLPAGMRSSSRKTVLSSHGELRSRPGSKQPSVLSKLNPANGKDSEKNLRTIYFSPSSLTSQNLSKLGSRTGDFQEKGLNKEVVARHQMAKSRVEARQDQDLVVIEDEEPKQSSVFDSLKNSQHLRNRKALVEYPNYFQGLMGKKSEGSHGQTATAQGSKMNFDKSLQGLAKDSTEDIKGWKVDEELIHVAVQGSPAPAGTAASGDKVVDPYGSYMPTFVEGAKPKRLVVPCYSKRKGEEGKMTIKQMEEDLSQEKDPDLPHFMKSLIGWDTNLQAKADRIVKVVRNKFIDSRKFETLVNVTVPDTPVYKQYGRVKQVTLTMDNFKKKVRELFAENAPVRDSPKQKRPKALPPHMVKEEGTQATLQTQTDSPKPEDIVDLICDFCRQAVETARPKSKLDRLLNPPLVDFDKVKLLKDIIYFTPSVVKRDKNAPSLDGIQYVLNPIIQSQASPHSRNTGRQRHRTSSPLSSRGMADPQQGSICYSPKKSEELRSFQIRLEEILDFISCGIKMKFTELSKAFQFFDQSNRLRISFPEFATGLEQLGIRLCQRDLENAFAYQDREGMGYLEFEQFCRLYGGKGKKIFDPVAKQLFEAQERVKAIRETTELEMANKETLSQVGSGPKSAYRGLMTRQKTMKLKNDKRSKTKKPSLYLGADPKKGGTIELTTSPISGRSQGKRMNNWMSSTGAENPALTMKTEAYEMKKRAPSFKPKYHKRTTTTLPDYIQASLPNFNFGNASLPSDSIDKILSYQYQNEFIKEFGKRKRLKQDLAKLARRWDRHKLIKGGKVPLAQVKQLFSNPVALAQGPQFSSQIGTEPQTAELTKGHYGGNSSLDREPKELGAVKLGVTVDALIDPHSSLGLQIEHSRPKQAKINPKLMKAVYRQRPQSQALDEYMLRKTMN